MGRIQSFPEAITRAACTRLKSISTAAAVASAVFLGAAAAEADYYDGLRLHDAGDVKGALEEWKRAALSGDIQAQRRLGDVYNEGTIVLQDYIEAHKWYNLAAVNEAGEAGDASRDTREARDEARYARNVLQGQMISRDIEEARRRFACTYEAGNATALYRLGRLYQLGAGLTQNNIEAYRFFLIAASKGSDEALGARDILAKKLKPAQIASGQAASRDWKVPTDCATATAFTDNLPESDSLKRAAEIGLAPMQRAMRHFGFYKEFVDGQNGPNTRKGFRAYQKSVGQSPTGLLTSNQIVGLITRAAQEKHTPSENTLGTMYVKGVGVAQNYPLAINWYEKAAAKGHCLAQFNLGVIHRDGLGVPADRDQARDYFKQSAKNKCPKAQKALNDL